MRLVTMGFVKVRVILCSLFGNAISEGHTVEYLFFTVSVLCTVELQYWLLRATESYRWTR
jgi:hypothetical protein